VIAPPSTILVVDDSAVNLQVLVRTLNGTGHRVLAARDGRSALAIAQRAHPDLMLLDVMMPDMDGFEVCRAIKADPATEDIGVIFLSALGEVSDKVSGLSLGAVDYVTKPILAAEVLALFATHLTCRYLEMELRRSRDSLNRELAGAARMQRLLLPPALPAHAAVRFAAHYQTSRHAGGDYYDVLPIDGDRFGVMVADVSGHGAPAAILMAMFRAVLHSYPGTADDPPAVLAHLDRHFDYLRDSGMFATAIYAVIDASRRTVRCSCAGHPLPLLVRDGAVTELRIAAVPPLLLFALGDVPCTEQALLAGDRLVLYTDGVTEREAPNGAMFEVDGLRDSCARAAALEPSQLVARLVADLNRFAADREPSDDATIVAIGID
jgi:sigma-B regulation protein RsbU (phosphoserine phosphatase)